MASRKPANDTVASIGAAIDGAQDAPIFADEGYGPFDQDGDYDEDFDRPRFPSDCPATPLGVQGDDCWYIDFNGQVISLGAGQRHGKNSLIRLLGPRSGWLEKHFSRWSEEKRDKDGNVTKPAEIVGFKQDEASRALIEECTRKGIFDPIGRIRGAGAHRGSGNGLILHCGDQVMRLGLRINGDPDEIEWRRPGLHGEHVYPAAGAIPRPWPDAAGPDIGMALRSVIATWRWKRPLLDPLLVVGQVGASLIGGALDWRPNLWITGGAGTGKSTLNGKRGLLDQLIGKAKLASADTSAAGIRQRLRNSTVPVFLDELEAEKDDRRARSVIELARVSSSGADAHRGGSDHNAMEFTLQSCFWASSVLIPAMETTDRSRWAICALDPLRPGDKAPNLRAMRLPEMGRKLLRRMVDGWPRFDETLAAYSQALADMGHKARACDQFGTLLACADLLIYDGLDLETVHDLVKLCDVSQLREVSQSAAEHEACLDHMRTFMVQARGGDERESVGSWIGRAVQDLCQPAIVAGDSLAHKRLQEIGIKIVGARINARDDDGRPTKVGSALWRPGGAERERGFVAIANNHQGLATVFRETKWQNGVWEQALARYPDAFQGVTVKFGRMAMRAVLVPLDAVIDASEVPASARWDGIAKGEVEA